MSDRVCLGKVKSSVITGDAVDVYRDNDTRSYRLFAYEGHRDVPIFGGHVGWQFDDCTRCELSFTDLKALADILNRAVEQHTPFEDLSDEP